jgi:type 1 glutamine amidotransferase
MKHMLPVISLSLTVAALSAMAADKPKAPAAPPAPPKPKVLAPVPEKLLADMNAAMPTKAPVPPAKPRKILVFWKCEGFFHGAGIAAGNEALKLLGQKTGAFNVTVVTDDYAYLEPAKLNEFDALVLNNTTHIDNKMTPEMKEGLLKFVKGGKGLIGIHAATDNFAKWPEGAEMIGGQFDGHPWGGGGTWAFKLDDASHPIVKAFGGQGFKLKDEIYQIKGAYSREKFHELISLDMSDATTAAPKGQKREDKDNPVAWIRPYGAGRVFYFSLGHNGEVFAHRGVLGAYLAGIQYALGDLKCDDSPSKK